MSLRGLARNSALYTIGNIAPKVGAFLLLPIYVRYLSQADYGSVALLTSFAGILGIVYRLGIDGALMRMHFDAEGWDRARLYVTAAAFTFVLSTVLTLVIGLALAPQFDDFFAGTPFLPLGLLALLIALSGTMQFIPSVLFRASGQPGRFLAINLGAFVVSSVASVILIVVVGLGAAGVLLGQLIANVAAFAVTLVIVARLSHAGIDPSALRGALRLGLPLLPHGLSAWALRLADRWLLAIFLVPSLDARAQIGVYAVGYQLGYVVTIIVTSFNTAWSPYFFRIGAHDHAPRLYRGITTAALAGVLAIAVAASALAPEIVALVARPGYEKAADVLPVIAFASVLQGAYTMFVTVVFFMKRTGPLALITFASAAVNIGLNMALIPPLGIMGAAWATLGAYGFFALATYLFARRLYEIRLPWIKLLGLAIGGVVVVLASRGLSGQASLATFATHVALGLAFTAVAWIACRSEIHELRLLTRSLPTEEEPA